MGMILDEIEGSAVSAEARRESFRLTTDDDSIELEWDQLPHLKALVMALEAHAPKCPTCGGSGTKEGLVERDPGLMGDRSRWVVGPCPDCAGGRP